MKTTLKTAVLAVAIVSLAGCVPPPSSLTPTLTPLEIQSLQTREYEDAKEIVFPSVLSVFQDLGYIIKTADKDTGFITAESPTEDTTGFLEDPSWITYSATAFIERIGQFTKVRLNLVANKEASSPWVGDSEEDIPILEAQAYQNAFEKIETAIFVRSSN